MWKRETLPSHFTKENIEKSFAECKKCDTIFSLKKSMQKLGKVFLKK